MTSLLTLRLKVKPESYPWLAQAAVEVNQVWNWANATSMDASDRNRRANARFLTGIDLGLKHIAVTSAGERLSAGLFFRGIEAKIGHAPRRGHKRQAKRLHRRASNRRRDALHKFTRRMVDRYELIVVGDVSSPKLARTRMAKSVLDAGWGMLRTQLLYKGEHAGRVGKVVSERNTTRACSSCGALAGPAGLDMLVVRRWVCAQCGALHDRDANAARNILTAGLRCRGESPGSTQILGKEPPSAGTSRKRERVRRARHHRRGETGSEAITRAA